MGVNLKTAFRSHIMCDRVRIAVDQKVFLAVAVYLHSVSRAVVVEAEAYVCGITHVHPHVA